MPFVRFVMSCLSIKCLMILETVTIGLIGRYSTGSSNVPLWCIEQEFFTRMLHAGYRVVVGRHDPAPEMNCHKCRS